MYLIMLKIAKTQKIVWEFQTNFTCQNILIFNKLQILSEKKIISLLKENDNYKEINWSTTV